MGRGGLSRRVLLLAGLAVAGGTVLSGALGVGRAWAADAPPIIDCDGWGARPSSRPVPIHPGRPTKIVVHHTATPNVDDLSRAAAYRLARGIQDFHMDRRGWLDSGQHFTISRGGFALEGRRHSLAMLRDGHRQVVGAHCTGQNLVAIGIENEGTYLDVDPPARLWDRLRELCAYTCRQYGIAPTEIYGHRDLKDTACPGDRLYGMLPRLRTEVAGALGQRLDGRAAIKATWPLLRAADRGAPVLAAQHLLRDVGMTVVVPDGSFGAPMADAVRTLQAQRGFEEVNGMIGGESWPALARTVRIGEGGEAQQAVDALVVARRTQSQGWAGVTVVTPPVWQRLLGTDGA